jgi:hypothetical protein
VSRELGRNFEWFCVACQEESVGLSDESVTRMPLTSRNVINHSQMLANAFMFFEFPYNRWLRDRARSHPPVPETHSPAPPGHTNSRAMSTMKPYRLCHGFTSAHRLLSPRSPTLASLTGRFPRTFFAIGRHLPLEDFQRGRGNFPVFLICSAARCSASSSCSMFVISSTWCIGKGGAGFHCSC